MDALKRNGISVVPVTDEYARRFIRKHDRVDKAQFRLVGQEILYSNARAALDSIRQEKATPAQWLAMLTKAGSIKADLLHSLSVKYFSDQLKQTQSTGMKR